MTAFSPALAQLTLLQHLDLTYNDIPSSSLPAFASALSQLHDLRWLSLAFSDLSDAPASFFASLQNLSHLEYLDLSSTGLQAKISDLFYSSCSSLSIASFDSSLATIFRNYLLLMPAFFSLPLHSSLSLSSLILQLVISLLLLFLPSSLFFHN